MEARGRGAGAERGRQRPALKPERLKQARLHVERAAKVRGAGGSGPPPPLPGSSAALSPQQKKIFVVQGPYPVIRSLLRARGWVEKRLPRPGRAARRREREAEADDSAAAPEGERAARALAAGARSSPPPAEEEGEGEEGQDEDPEGTYSLLVSAGPGWAGSRPGTGQALTRCPRSRGWLATRCPTSSGPTGATSWTAALCARSRS